MSNVDKPNQSSNDLSKKEIIEEKIGNTTVNFSDIFKLYQERILLKKGKNNLFLEDELKDLKTDKKKI